MLLQNNLLVIAFPLVLQLAQKLFLCAILFLLLNFCFRENYIYINENLVGSGVSYSILLTPLVYPKKMHFLDFESNFILGYYTLHPKIWEKNN